MPRVVADAIAGSARALVITTNDEMFLANLYQKAKLKAAMFFNDRSRRQIEPATLYSLL
jgi:hypothetical protein